MQKKSYILVVIDMFVSAVVKKAKSIILTLCTLCLCTVVLMYSKSCAEGAVEGIKMCLSTLIPSLFPFMALSSFIVKSGLSEKIGRPFGSFMNKLFGLDACFAPVIMLSMIGGYPVGAKGISTLYNRGSINQNQAERAIMFAVCAGPGFLMNYVGVSLYENEKIGAIILTGQILSMIIIGTTLHIFDRKNDVFHNTSNLMQKKLPLSNCIVEAAADSAKGILNISVFVVLFSAFTGIIQNFIGDGIFKNLILCLLEVCSAVDELSLSAPVEAVAFAVGFGGLCVHFQIFSAIEEIHINKLKFFCIRIIQGVLTGLFAHFGINLFIGEATVFSTAQVQQASTSGGTVISGIALVTVSLCFLYTLKSYKSR